MKVVIKGEKRVADGTMGASWAALSQPNLAQPKNGWVWAYLTRIGVQVRV